MKTQMLSIFCQHQLGLGISRVGSASRAPRPLPTSLFLTSFSSWLVTIFWRPISPNGPPTLQNTLYILMLSLYAGGRKAGT